MSAGKRKFEASPSSPNYSPQSSDDEDGENYSVDGDGLRWWEREPLKQRELERQERCIRLADKAHIELIHALPKDICPTLETVLQYTEYVSLGGWYLLEIDLHFYIRIMENFLVPGGIN